MFGMTEHRLTRYWRAQRQGLLEAMGGRCVRCGENDWRVLQFDHVNGRNGERCKMLTRKVVQQMLALFTQGELQVLCANCNWRKRHEERETFRRYKGCEKEQVVVE